MHPRDIVSLVHGRLADPNGVLPWAETNQGLLSLFALIVALAIAVYEVKRAARSERRSERAYCDWAISSAEHSMRMTKEAIYTILTDDTSIYRMSLSGWRFHNDDAIAKLEEIVSDKPRNPELTHHVNRLLRTMKMNVKGSDASQEALDDLRNHFTYTEIARDHIKRVRPKSDRERLAGFVNIALQKVLSVYPALRYWRPFKETLPYAALWGQPFDLTKRPY